METNWNVFELEIFHISEGMSQLIYLDITVSSSSWGIPETGWFIVETPLLKLDEKRGVNPPRLGIFRKKRVFRSTRPRMSAIFRFGTTLIFGQFWDIHSQF